MEDLVAALSRFNAKARAKAALTADGKSTSAQDEDKYMRASFSKDPIYDPSAPYAINQPFVDSLTNTEAVNAVISMAATAATNAQVLQSPFPGDLPDDPEACDPATTSAFILPSSPEEITAAVAAATASDPSLEHEAQTLLRAGPVRPPPREFPQASPTASASAPASASFVSSSLSASVVVPRIYPRPVAPSQLRIKLEKECRTRYLEALAQSLLPEAEIAALWRLLLENETAPLWRRDAEDSAAETAGKVSWCKQRSAPEPTNGPPQFLTEADITRFRGVWGPVDSAAAAETAAAAAEAASGVRPGGRGVAEDDEFDFDDGTGLHSGSAAGSAASRRALSASALVALAGRGVYNDADALGARIRAAVRFEQQAAATAAGGASAATGGLCMAAQEDLEAGERVDYIAYRACARACEQPAEEGGAPAVAPLLTPSLFARFPRDSLGRISVRTLHRYICERAAATRARISLACFDEEGMGFLREADLETYVLEQIPAMPPLRDLDAGFSSYYAFSVVRKFLFFFDPKKKGRVSIAEMVTSPVFKDFNSIRLRQYEMPRINAMLHMNSDQSWYSAPVTRAVYDQYISLDTNRNGMLSKDEMYQYNGGSISPLVIDRLFESCRLYEAADGSAELEMDYKTYLDFAIAVEHRSTVPALTFFFNILDLHSEGFLTEAVVRTLFCAVHARIPNDTEAPDIDSVVTELFDLAEPQTPGVITLKDLIKCGSGGHIVGILVDSSLFTAYDQREWVTAPKRVTH